MRLKNYIAIFVLFLGLIFAKSSLAYSDIKSDPASCGTDAFSQTCVGGQFICGINPGNNVVSCALPSSLTPPATSNPVESGTATASGGYMIDCQAFDAGAPYCNNNGQFVCYQNSTCSNAGRQTVCSFSNWTTKSSSCGNCKSTHTDCDATAVFDCRVRGTIANCATHDYCAQASTICTACNSGYTLINNACYTSVKLAVDSVLSDRLRNSTSTNPTVNIFSTGLVSIGSTTPSSTLSIFGGNVFIHDAVITSATPYAAITKTYLDSTLLALTTDVSASSFWKGSGNNIWASSTAWNVGIGTASPSLGKLQIDTPASSTWLYLENSSETGFYTKFFNNGSQNGSLTPFTKLSMGHSGFGDNASINFYRGGGTSGGFLAFTTNNDTERMRIDNAGQIGIGTTTPSSALDIFSKIHITSNGTIYNTDNGRYLDMTGVLTDSLKVSGDIYSTAGELKTDGTGINYMLGSLGIGTSSPTYKLDVNGQGRFIGSTAANPALRLGVGTGGIMSSGTNDVALVSNAINVATFVAASATDVRFQINTTNYSTMFGQYEGNWSGVTNPMIMQPLSPATSHDIAITGVQNSPTSGLVIKSTGLIGIGTTNPGAKLQVEGTFRVSGALNSVVLDKLTGTGNRVVMADASGSLYATSSSNALPSGTAGQTLRHDGTNWLANSFLYNNGTAIGIGTITPRATLEVGANDGINASIVAGNVIEVAGQSEVAQGADITITGGTLVSGGPTAKNGKGYWDITTFPSTITFNTRGWWTYAGMSFTAANVHNYPAGGGNKLPANFLVEASSDGTAWVTVENVTGYTSALYYKNNVYGGSGKFIRITATAPQAGETTAKLANVQIFNGQRSGKNPFSLSAEGSAVFLGGNVGLGNTNPGSLLTVGTGSTALNFTSGGTFYNSDNTRWLRFDNLLTDSLKVQGNIYTTAGLFKSDAATGNNYMLSNLGIGTASPGDKLDIYSASDHQLTIRKNGASSLTIHAGGSPAIIWKNNTSLLFGTKTSDTGITGFTSLMQLSTSGSLSLNGSVVSSGTGNNSFVGSVGIATTTPDAKLNVNGTFHVTGALNTVAIDNLGTGGGGTVMSDASGVLYTTQTSGIGRFRAVTAVSTGNQGGYTGANARCEGVYPGSHVCTSAEMLNTINTGHTADIPSTTGIWISSGPPAYFANVNDCLGWTDNASYGTIWIKSTADGYGSIGLCGSTYPVACCK